MKQIMRIADLRATAETVPLEAPLRHANGCHWGRLVRAVVEVETDSALVGLGEMGGGGAKSTASLYNNRTQMLAALEFACLDVPGQAWGMA